MKVKMKNEQIYTIGHLLASSFNEIDNQYLPAKVNFLFQKNKQTMIELTKELENARISIVKHFGVLNEETNSFETVDAYLPNIWLIRSLVKLNHAHS